MRKRLRSFWLPAFVFATVLIIIYKTIDRLPEVFSSIFNFLSIFNPIIAAVIISFILFIPVKKLESMFMSSKSGFLNRTARGISVAITYATLAGLIALLLYYVIPRIIGSTIDLVNNLPNYYNAAMNYLDTIAKNGKILSVQLTDIKERFSVSTIITYFDLDSIPKYAGELVKVGSFLGNAMLSLIMSIYMLLDRERIIKAFSKVLSLFVKQKYLHTTSKYIKRGCEIFYQYLYSTMLDALIVACVMSFLITLVGAPYSILLGIFVGLCNLIPYFGGIFSCIISVLITFIATGDYVKALLVLVVVLGFQQIDANVIQPRIIGGSLGVRPIYVLFSIVIGGGLFGFTGILVAVPATAFIKMLIVDYMKSKNAETIQIPD